jgi:methyl-accepting chemotaxis protein WspA
MLKNLSIKKNSPSASAPSSSSSSPCWLAYTNFTKLSAASGWDRHTLEVLLEAGQIETSMVQIQSSVRGFLLTGDDSIAQQIGREEDTLRHHLELVTASRPTIRPSKRA